MTGLRSTPPTPVAPETSPPAVGGRTTGLDRERAELTGLAAHVRSLLAQGPFELEAGAAPQSDEALITAAQQYLALASRLGDDEALAEALSYLISAEQRQGAFVQAMEHLRQETDVRARLGDWAGQVECLNNLGMLYATLGDYAEALTTLFQCQQLSVQYPGVPTEYRAACLVNIGHTYLAMGQHAQALDYLLPGLEAATRAGDQGTQLSALSELGLVYKAQGRLPLALQTLTRGLELAEAADSQEQIDLTDNLGQVYSEMGKYAQARALFRRSLSQAEEEEDVQGRVNAKLSLGRLHFLEGQPGEAQALLQRALETALLHNLRQSALDLYQALYQGFERVGDLAAAFPHLRAYQALSRQVFNENSERRSQTLTARFEAERARQEADMYRQIGEVSQTARLQAEETVRVRTTELEAAQVEIVTRLGMAAEYRDDETGQHTRRVGELSGHLAQALGLPHETVDLIRWAARLHDIGKIGIPDSVLLKNGRYTPEEFGRMKAHTVIGAKVLEGSTSPLLRMAEEIARTHHERWDGLGYPNGLSGQGIPVSGRIVAVADVFDALTTARLYKPAWSVEEALVEMRTLAGSQFDPVVIDCLLALIDSHLSSVGDLLTPGPASVREPQPRHPQPAAPTAPTPGLAEMIERAWALRQTQPQEAEALALEGLRLAESGTDELLLGRAHRAVGWFRFMSSDFEEALGHLVNGLDIGVAYSDLGLQADCANFMAGVYNSLADYDKATDQLSVVLRIAREQQDRQREAHCLHNLGFVSTVSRSLDNAQKYLSESLAAYREIGDHVGETTAMGSYASLAFEQGDYRLAVRLATQAASEAKLHGQAHVEAIAKSTAGKAHAKLAQYDPAEALQKEALEYAVFAGHRESQAWSLYELGQVYQGRADGVQAHGVYVEALGLAQELNTKELEMKTYRSLSELRAEAGDAASALDYYQKHHAVELEIFSQEASLKTRALMVQMEVERVKSDAQIYKLRSIELASANEALERANAEKSGLVNMLEDQSKLLKRQLSEDGLTGLYNRKHIEGVLQHEFWQQKSSSQLLCIAMVDLDHFKQINDRFSHLAGDQVLRVVAQLFTHACRPSDSIGRYGGEEFLFVFPGTTLEQGRMVCERVQAAIRDYDWNQVHPGLKVTLSIGLVADLSVPNHERLISRADTKLYEAKNSGRDRICL
ncbi:tetratricopeptide repeat protein [Deinococcus sp.]|uniref:tetratricopeptide repeat protein n=1 Tax=Deinococcus sp. TaxID=47478 RepID=UPI003C7B2AD9